MVATTLRDAIGHVAASFRGRDRRSPFHHKEGSLSGGPLRANIRDLLKAFETRDPPTKRQRALTPEMLQDLKQVTEDWGDVSEHTSDLIEGAYFFAMRACEFCKTRKKGKTRPLTLEHITFRDKYGRSIEHSVRDLETRARFVTICWVDQKNGIRMDRRTQQATGERLCPARAWARVVRRVRSTVEGANRHTPAFQLSDQDDNTILISSERVSDLIRLNCEINGVTKGYGCTPKDLGTRSIRSGAAMGLFLMDHSVEKIMILGRWSSDAFMVYIRPQVLEWTNIMSRDLALAGNYRDLGYQGKGGAIRPDKSILGRGGLIPRFYLGR
jgi:hypothetical protein